MVELFLVLLVGFFVWAVWRAFRNRQKGSGDSDVGGSIASGSVDTASSDSSGGGGDGGSGGGDG
jgi:hypothetical protein